MAVDKGAASVRPSKEPRRPSQAPAQARGNGLGARVQKYLGEVMTELRKTTWPSKADLIAHTQVVIGLLVVVGVFIATWDFLLGQIFRGVLRLMGVTLPE